MPQYYRREIVTCPHCDREFNANMLEVHKAKCPLNPALFDRIRAALDDGTGEIVTSVRYQADVERRAGLVASQPLYRACGTWKDVARVFGLRWSNPLTRPKPNYKKPVKRLSAPLDDDEQTRNVPGEHTSALEYRSPHVEYGPFDMPVCRVIVMEREVRYVLR